MKAGILTFHRALNYGAVLQTYALCKVMNNEGVDCVVVDYYSEPLEATYKIFNFQKEKPVKVLMKGIMKSGVITRKRKGFQAFVEKNIPLSSEQYHSDTISQANSEYDFFITGSDQVWSPSCVGFDEVYFLTFADKAKRNSYAASIGCKVIPEDKKKEYLNRLQDYRHISVRETNAIDLLKGIGIASEMERHIDPTLLLEADDYEKIAQPPQCEKYVLLFSVNMPVNLIDYAKKLAASKNLKVIYLNDRPINKIKGIIYENGVSPEEFLGYIKNAEYVVTNSFHGTVFSLIFKKRFFVEYNTKNGKNTRAEELLERLAVTDREIKNTELMEDRPINWDNVVEILNDERSSAVAYLRKVIGDYRE